MSRNSDVDSIRSLIVRAVRYGLVGVLATVLYAIIALVGVWLGFDVFHSHIVAYISSITASYLGQKVYTFEISGQHRRFGVRYVMSTMFLATTQTLIVFTLSRYTSASSGMIVAVSSFYYMPASFLINTFWTFKRAPGQG